ncbi:tRNA (adenosine(37)-N6)-threonylcarbamoyltransferase complex ATPase subunit type 1 TsaE [Nocardioides sp.]|uniref:tRNA (adenosine(37)-N6)-threonylcarbamoyltransferase complex ATPase subunit type 1 TsaE n=1 Tax=Nocardioides sp. TaxID=35761 RepID=UPI003D0AF371
MIDVRLVGAEAAPGVLGVIHAAFGARAPLDPPTSALSETLESVASELGQYGGLLVELDGRQVGSLIFEPVGSTLGLRRFGVLPEAQGTGVATALIAVAQEQARARGCAGMRVVARVELPATIAFWEHQGFVEVAREGVNVHLAKLFATSIDAHTRADTQAVAETLAPRLRAGDLIILSGDLGAGKTTFTQGLGRALGVRGDITSPTFVIARVHPSLTDGPALVHVDAYRLGGLAELDDLDLDTSLDDAVTVVEWGSGVAESLASDRLEITLTRALGDVSGVSVTEDHDPRRIVIQPVGLRWA